jgi:hypothetical protein
MTKSLIPVILNAVKDLIKKILKIIENLTCFIQCISRGVKKMVNTLKLTSALVLKVRTGVDATGNDLFRNISLKKVKPTASEQDMFDVAQAIAAVLNATVSGIFRQDTDEIVNA